MDDVLDRAFRIEQATSNVSRVEPVRQQLENFDFTIRQHGEAQATRVQDLPLQPTDLIEQPAKQVGRQGSLAACRRADGFKEVLGRGLIPAEHSASPRLQCRQQPGVVDPGHDEHDAFNTPAFQRPDGLGGLLVHLVGNHEGHHVGIDLALLHHVEPVVRAKLAGNAGAGDGVGCGDVDACTVS